MLTVLEPIPVEPERLARFASQAPKRIDFGVSSEPRLPGGVAGVNDACANGDLRPRAPAGSGRGHYSICRECYRARNALLARVRRAKEAERRRAARAIR